MVDDLSSNPSGFPSFGEGSQAEFWQLYKSHISLLHQFIMVQCRDTKIARQVVEYVFARAWACWTSFEDEDRFVFFLYSEAALRLKELREQAEHEVARQAVTVGGREKEYEADWSVFMGIVREAIDRLPGQRRMAILEHYINGKPVKQIAAEQSIAEQTVWNHLLRGMVELRKVLNGFTI